MNIIVTGASKGIGFETALEFCRHSGNRVIALSRDEKRLDLLKQAASSSPGEIHIHKFDISNIDRNALDALLAPFDAIDAVVHNAGFLINKRFQDIDLRDWQATFDVNVFGIAHLTQLLLPWLKKSGMAHIVNIGSMGGLQGTSKFPGLVAYSASKAALANMTECLAEELKEYNIRVNCLALGSVNTEMLNTAFPDYKAPTDPHEMANFITWFAMNAANLMNGKIIPISINTP